MSVIHHPHDNFFRAVMKNQKVAMEFLQHHLPAEIRNQLDLTTLELQPGSYVNDALESSASDILFKVNYKKKPGFAYIYVLAEHQSGVEHLMSFRILEYLTAIWRELIRKNESQSRNKSYRLPLIVPLVFYAGPEKYHGTTDIRDLIAAPPELIEKFLFQPFHLIDLNEIGEEEMKTRKWFGIVEFVMQNVRRKREILDFIQSLSEQLCYVRQQGAIRFESIVLSYTLSQARIDDQKRLKETLRRHTTMSTFLKYLVQEDVEECLKQRLGEVEEHKDIWIQKGEATLLISQLEDKFTDLPEHYKQKIETAGSHLLLQWGKKILKSQSLEEVFAS